LVEIEEEEDLATVVRGEKENLALIESEEEEDLATVVRSEGEDLPSVVR
jgi:hypothetical protein